MTATRHGKRCLFVHGHNRTKLNGYADDYTVKDKGYKTPCWVWKGKPNEAGYGRTQKDKKTVLAHRAVYEEYKGEIPAERELDHLCRVPPCVNPEHLDPVTHLENVRRGRARTYTQEKADEAQRLRDSGASILSISRHIGADWETVKRYLK